MIKTSTWTKKQCLSCNKSFFVGSDWNNPPSTCDFCRAKKVENIIGKLKSYLKQRAKIKLQARLADKSLRRKIEYILCEPQDDENLLIKKLITDKEIRKLILRLDKESKSDEKSRMRYAQQKTGTNAIIGKLHFVQGGSPGQGKKS
jgi:hypothetical protein